MVWHPVKDPTVEQARKWTTASFLNHLYLKLDVTWVVALLGLALGIAALVVAIVK